MGRRIFYAEISGFDDYIRKLNSADADTKAVVTGAMKTAAESPTKGTVEGVKKPNLPAKGKYSTGDTEKTVIENPDVLWQGNTGAMGIGFDRTKNGVGTLLITGTPRMKPAKKLEQIYSRKKTVNEFNRTVGKIVSEELAKKLNGS